MPIDVDHPDGQSNLNHSNTYPQQAVPERIGRGQRANNLQERGWEMERGTGKNDQHEPEEPAPMPHPPKDKHGDHGKNTHLNSVTGAGERSAGEEVSESECA